MHNDHKAYKTLSKMLFDEMQLDEILSKIKSSDKELMVLLNDSKVIEFCKEYNPKFVEIHFVCINDYHLIKKLNSSFNKDTNIVL